MVEYNPSASVESMLADVRHHQWEAQPGAAQSNTEGDKR